MQIDIVAIGRMKKGSETELFERYLERFKKISKNYGIIFGKVLLLNESQKSDALQRKFDEAEKLASVVKAYDFVIGLDEKGREFTSKEFADFLQNKTLSGISSCCFLLGGPDGFYKKFLEKCDLCLSLGKMTLPHQLARIFIVEQLYRAMTILAQHPYHRD